MRTVLFGYLTEETLYSNPVGIRELLEAFLDKGYCPVHLYARQKPWGLSIPTPSVTALRYHYANQGNLPETLDYASAVRGMQQQTSQSEKDSLIYYCGLYNFVEQIISELKPSLFIGWNPLEAHCSIPASICRERSIPILSIESGILPGSWRLDEQSMAHRNGTETTSQHYVELGNRLLSNEPVSAFSTRKQNKDEKLDQIIASKRSQGYTIALVLGTEEHYLNAVPGTKEKTIFLPHFDDSYQIAESVSRDSQYFTLFKPHPIATKHKAGLHRSNDRVYTCFADPINLIRQSDIVVGVYGKLEAAAIKQKKPYIRAGCGFFNSCPITPEIMSQEKLHQQLNDLLESYNAEETYRRLANEVGHLYSSRWLLFPNHKTEPIEGVLTTDDWVDLALKPASHLGTSLSYHEHIETVSSIQCRMITQSAQLSDTLGEQFRKLAGKLFTKLYSKFSLLLTRFTSQSS